MNHLSNQHFCLVCKEFADPRFTAAITDNKTSHELNGQLCTHCYETFVASSHNTGMFRVSKLRTWLRHWRKDWLRAL